MGREIWNAPNTVTILRTFLVVPTLMLWDIADPRACLWAALLFGFATALDFVDGWLARATGAVTTFGKLVDPLSDKILVLAISVALVAAGQLPVWVVAVLTAREFYISGIRQLAAAQGLVMAASSGGKLKTILQDVGLATMLAHYSYPLPGAEIWLDLHLIGLVCMYASLAVSLWSAAEYTGAFYRALGTSGSSGGSSGRSSGAPSSEA